MRPGTPVRDIMMFLQGLAAVTTVRSPAKTTCGATSRARHCAHDDAGAAPRYVRSRAAAPSSSASPIASAQHPRRASATSPSWRQREQALAQAKEDVPSAPSGCVMQTVLDNMNDGTILIDKDFNFVFGNNQYSSKPPARPTA